MSRIALIAIAVPVAAAGSAAVAVAGGASGAVTWIGVLALVGLLGAVVAGSANPSLQLFGPAILRGPGDRQEVALTFDDGPDPASTEALLAALDSAGATATFFVLVDRAEAHPELFARIAARHEVALHGLHHDPWLTIRPPSAGADELRAAATRLEALTGTRPRWYRPPFGATSPRLVQAVDQAGLELVWCSIRTLDGVALAADKLRERVARARAGDIVLLHEGERPCRDVLPQILDDLSGRGLRAVTLQELLAP